MEEYTVRLPEEVATLMETVVPEELDVEDWIAFQIENDIYQERMAASRQGLSTGSQSVEE